MEFINVATFNCNGFDQSILQTAINKQSIPTILCIQETWKYNLNEFNKCNKNRFHTIHVTAMDETLKSRGRPHGGIGMFIDKKICFKTLHKDKNFLIIKTAIKVSQKWFYIERFICHFQKLS